MNHLQMKMKVMKRHLMQPDVKIKRLNFRAKTPEYKTSGSSGCDVFACEDVILYPNSRGLVSTGLVLEMPDGYECQVRPRSGLALNHGLTVFNSPGSVDNDFRGEIKILLYNSTARLYQVKIGDRIAQLVFAPVCQATFEDKSELSVTERGEGGWGSSGT